MTLKIRAILLASALFSASLAAHAQEVKEFMLQNGMKIIVKEDHRAPTVAHMVWYKVGSIDEVNGLTGISHALEHMMFKGTKKYKAGEFSRLVASLGGRENAFTSRDYTAYYQQVEKSRLEAVMALEADRMNNLQFNKDEFAKEIRVVMEERRWRTEDQPMGLLAESLNAATFMAHPYHHPVVGWMSDLENMTITDIAAWYHRWYAPNNATMVVVGDVDASRVKELAEKYYGKFAKKTLMPTRPQVEPEQRGIRRTSVKAPAENPYVALAFKVPALRDVEKDDDVYALSVLAAVLDGYDNARLTAKLVRTDKVANSVSASYDEIGRGPSTFTLGGRPAGTTDVVALEAMLRAEVDRIAQEGISEEELSRVKRQIIAGQIYKRDSTFGQAMELGATELSGISHRQLGRIVEKLKLVQAQQVQDVAKKYFGDDGLTVATLVPLSLSEKTTKPQSGASTGGQLR